MNLTPSTLRLLRCKLNKRKKRRKLEKEKRLSQKKMPSKYEIAELHMQQLIQNAHKIEQVLYFLRSLIVFFKVIFISTTVKFYFY